MATIGRYQDILDESLAAIAGSALFPRLDHLGIHVVGNGPVHCRMADPRVVLVRADDDVSAFERPTLEAMQRHALAFPRSRVLYLNGLGGRYRGADFDNRAAWRRMLYFLLIERSAHALSLLDQHDACGVEWVAAPLPHMTSNNWWATARHLASLPTPASACEMIVAQDLARFGPHWRQPDVKARHAGEFWLGMSPTWRPCSLFPLGRTGLPRSQYGVVPWWEMRHVPWDELARRGCLQAGGAGARLAAPRRWLLTFTYRAKSLWRQVRMRWQNSVDARTTKLPP